MDFKVAGTHKGITAIQMDIKIHGLTRPIIEEAIARTKEARTYILDNIMAPAIAEPRPEVGEYAPKIEQIHIDPQKIGDVVGQKGKVINQIIDETGVDVYKRQKYLRGRQERQNNIRRKIWTCLLYTSRCV